MVFCTIWICYCYRHCICARCLTIWQCAWIIYCYYWCTFRAWETWYRYCFWTSSAVVGVPNDLVIGLVVGSYLSLSGCSFTVTGTSTWSFVPSGYVTVAGTVNVQAFDHLVMCLDYLLLLLVCLLNLDNPEQSLLLTSSAVVGVPKSFVTGVTFGSYLSLSGCSFTVTGTST